MTVQRAWKEEDPVFQDVLLEATALAPHGTLEVDRPEDLRII
jgi:hypothetical protein